VPFCPQSSLSGLGFQPDDVVWYRRTFDAPEAERLLLRFGAVDYRATVWVNGEEVGSHEGGHTPFVFEITQVVEPTRNVVVVRAEDPLADQTVPRGKQYWGTQPEGIFYTPTTGIWQTVWLEPVPNRHIRSLRITPDFDGRAVDVEVDAEGPKYLTVSLDDSVVARWEGSRSLARVELPEAKLWSPEQPNLYDLRIRVGDDTVFTYFGMRKVETKGGHFLLNREPYVQRLVLDQGYFPGGWLTAATDDDLRRDIELAKAMGFNGARKHQKVEDPRWLYWADLLGFLVWAEMPNFHQATPEAEARLETEWREAVLRDRNHPSVVAWVPINESFGLSGMTDRGKAAYLSRLRRATQELDTTRLVMSNDGWEHVSSDMCTLHDYSSPEVLRARYSSLASALADDAREHPPYLPGHAHHGEPVVVSEFGGVAIAGGEGFGWSQVADADGLLATYRDMVEALMGPGPVDGFCYTQLTDVEQEQNGWLTFDRRPKVELERLRPVTETPKRGG